MHESVMKFGHDTLTPAMIKGKRVLEVGSYNVNGSLRSHVQSMHPLQYLGIDLQHGPGVDAEMDFCAMTKQQVIDLWPDRFDLIISTEMLEHAEHWRVAINNMKAVLKPGGWLLLTTRGVGFPRHGYPSDYWRFDCKDMQSIFADYKLRTIADPQVPGVFVLAQKLTDDIAVDLSKIEVYSMNPKPTARFRTNPGQIIMPRLVPDLVSSPVLATTTHTPRLAGMLRVKNESRWIARVIESIKPICNAGIFILDDKSTDDTPRIARECGATVILSSEPGINETRDKNFLFKSIMELSNPDWVLHIDGDEELEPAGREVIKQAIIDRRGEVFALQVMYLWNRENQIRVDGIFGNTWRYSLFCTANTDGIFRSTIHGIGTAANLHCLSVPADFIPKGGLLNINARLIHYGYIDRDMRMAKWDFYNTVDPDNLLEDRYRHAVAGDIPEVPAWARTKWAGPLTLENFTPRSTQVQEVVNA